MWRTRLNPIQPDFFFIFLLLQRHFKPFCWLCWKAAFPSSKYETRVVNGMPGRDMFDIKPHYRGCQIRKASYISSWSCATTCISEPICGIHGAGTQRRSSLKQTMECHLPTARLSWGGVPSGALEPWLTRLKEGKTMKNTGNISI